MIIDCNNIDVMSIGSYFLSAGGCADFLYPELMAWQQLSKRNVHVMPLSALQNNDLVVPIGNLGSPIFESEIMHNCMHFENLFNKIEKTCMAPIRACVPLGVGGGHYLQAVFFASYFNLPIIDADFFGRCFPSVEMLSTAVLGILPKQAFFANVRGHVFDVSCNNFMHLEEYARQIAMVSGGFCTAVPQVLTGAQAQQGMIPGTLSQILEIGQAIQDTQDVTQLPKHIPTEIVGTGGIVAVDELKGCAPFIRRIVIRNLNDEKIWYVLGGSEFDVLLEGEQVIAQAPDIITFCNPKTGEPYNPTQLKYGINVTLFRTKAPDIWYSEKGMKLVRRFKPFDDKIIHQSIHAKVYQINAFSTFSSDCSVF